MTTALLIKPTFGWYAEMKGGADGLPRRRAGDGHADAGHDVLAVRQAERHPRPLNKVFFKYVENPTGFDPAEMAAMRTQASEQNATEFQNAEQAFQNKANIMGGREIPSGANLQAELMLQMGRARQEADSQRQITLNDAMLKRTNQFNAASILSGNAAMMNPVGYGQLASNTSTTLLVTCCSQPESAARWHPRRCLRYGQRIPQRRYEHDDGQGQEIMVSRLEALADSIVHYSKWSDPESLAYQNRNPGELLAVSPKHPRDVDGKRIFRSFMDGYQALIFDLAIKCSAVAHARA
jgi:hypothetical protein